MVEEIKVTRNYKIRVPSAARAKLGIKVGDVLVADFQDGKIVLRKKSSNVTKLRIRLNKKIDWRDVEGAVREVGDKVGAVRR